MANDVIEDLLQRLGKVSRRLAKRFAGELTKRACEATLAQIAGWQAMIWRYHAEVGMASIAAPANLVKAAAVLDEFAAGFPEGDRFHLHFRLAIDKPDPAFAPATLAFMGWHLQGWFADGFGRLRSDIDKAAFTKVKREIERPMPAEFFRALGDETVMQTLVASLYRANIQSE